MLKDINKEMEGREERIVIVLSVATWKKNLCATPSWFSFPFAIAQEIWDPKVWINVLSLKLFLNSDFWTR